MVIIRTPFAGQCSADRNDAGRNDAGRCGNALKASAEAGAGSTFEDTGEVAITNAVRKGWRFQKIKFFVFSKAGSCIYYRQTVEQHLLTRAIQYHQIMHSGQLLFFRKRQPAITLRK